MPKFLIGILVLGLSTSLSAQGGKFLFLKNKTIQLPPFEHHTDALKIFSKNINSTSAIYFLIQFKNSIDESTKEFLKTAGLEIKNYLPEDALILKGNSKSIDFAMSVISSQIQAVSTLRSEWKLDDNLFTLSSLNRSVRRDLLHLRIFDETESLEIQHELKTLSEVSVRTASGKSIVVESAPESFWKLAQIEGVEWVQPMPIIVLFYFLETPPITIPTTPPPLTGYESGTKLMGFEKAWERGFNGKGQIVAMADSGVDMGDVTRLHKDLGQVIKGYPMGYQNTSWADPMGHGTHVCGSVVGTGTASEASGTNKIRGGAFAAQMIAEGMWNSLFNNLIVETDFERLMGTPYNDGARIHTNSWGSALSQGVYDNFAAMVDEVIWKRPDLLILFAAGNGGQDSNKDGRIDAGSISSPGTAKNVLTVGASENLLAQGGIQKRLCDLKDGATKWGTEPLCSDTLSNNPEGIAAFSSRGPTKDGRLKPEVVAPGTNIVSVRSQHPNAKKLWGEYNGDYLYAGGTSMATPLVAGAVTVARQFLVDAKKIANPSAALVKATLIHTAKDLYPGQYGEGPQQELLKKRPNTHEGFGRVDMDALTSLDENTQFLDHQTGLGLKEEDHLKLELREGESLRATLVYSDPQAALTAGKALVNDLDLVITTPDGREITLNDHTNNVEMLELTQLAQGNYQVVVRGKNIPMGKNGKQPFALVVSRW